MQHLPSIFVITISLFQPISSYILHSYTFPGIPYSAGIYHIHSPTHFMDAHGFALPGFKITDTRAPQWIGNYIVAEFNFTTHFGPMAAKVFSSTPDTSHILVRDCSGSPCIIGRLKVQKLSASGHIVYARGDSGAAAQKARWLGNFFVANPANDPPSTGTPPHGPGARPLLPRLTTAKPSTT